MSLWLVSVLTFLSLFCFGLFLRGLLFAGQYGRQSDLKRRLAEVGPPEEQVKLALQNLLRDQSLSSIGALDRFLVRLPRVGDLELLLHRAGRPCNLGTLVMLAGVLALVGFCLGIFWGSWLMAAGLFLAGMLAPVQWLKFKAKKRLAAFEEQFPEAVELIARALRAGHGLGSALQMVAQEMDDPVAEEFARTFAAYSYGKTMEEALMELMRRVGLKDLKFFVTAVIMQRETGGNLTEVLDNIGHIIRQRFRLMRQLKAVSAEGRLSGRILSALAPVLFMVLWFSSPKYLAVMFKHPWGEPMLWTGAAFQVMGMLVIKRLVKFRV